MRVLLTLCFFSLVSTSFAGGTFLPGGVRAAAMGGNSVLLYDHWAGLNNPAGLARLSQYCIGASVARPYNIALLNNSSISMGVPIKNAGVLGISAQAISVSSAYQQTRVGASLARGFGEHFSAGITLGIYHFNFGTYGQNTFLSASAGFIFHPTKKLDVGAFVLNPFSPIVSEYQDERLPMFASSGFTYHFTDSFFLSTAIEINLDGQYRLRNGIEYLAGKRLVLRAGFATKPVETSFGIGLKSKFFQLNFSLSYHSVLGSTPHLSFDYAQDS